MRKKLKRPARGVPGASEHKGKLDATSLRNNTARPGEQRRIDEIRIGARHRKDLGDVDSLAASIADVGLLHAIAITPNGTLIAGERRLEAVKRLGWADVPVRVVDLEQIVLGEFAENGHRKDFLPSEVDAIRRAIEPLEKAAAKQRMSQGGKGAKLSHPSRVTDRIGAFAGLSGRSVEKIAKVVEAVRGAPKYALMDREQLLALPVESWAEDSAHLYLWTTNALMPTAVGLMAAWGFEHKSILTWAKPHWGLGQYFRGQTEHVLF